MNILTQAEINDHLHRFNLTNDWSVFDDVPPEQQVDVMYPTVIVIPIANEPPEATALRRKEILNQLFGPLA